jgi:hypothetical protein
MCPDFDVEYVYSGVQKKVIGNKTRSPNISRGHLAVSLPFLSPLHRRAVQKVVAD